MEDKQNEYSLLGRAIVVGLVGGLGGSILGGVMYYFNFSEVAPNYYLFIPITKIISSGTWVNFLISIVMASACSILIAIVYYGVFRKINSMWIGFLYGIFLWMVVFVFLQPVYPNVQKIQNWNNNTIVSTISLFILYGTFIGYSVSHDYYDTLKQGSNKRS